MGTKSKWRWPRFSLGTMFVSVTAISVWLGGTMSIIRERQTVLNDLRASPGYEAIPASAEPSIVAGRAKTWDDLPVPKISFVREFLGDQAISSIRFPADRVPAEYEVRYLKRVFPEAMVVEIDTRIHNADGTLAE